ncbi:hypothetical protein BC936DRAFT_148407 [Jimgerdemannia flammicorona]|uniref:Uncharacterized protein n=1 Tax=Jimgerdemannia flammicorona TaxID=994334 RepID=A0A433D350_9FUNG|nr:hypothetical protein BC936DRAFT_148407 [Jimgerdemannia flammicorona]
MKRAGDGESALRASPRPENVFKADGRIRGALINRQQRGDRFSAPFALPHETSWGRDIARGSWKHGEEDGDGVEPVDSCTALVLTAIGEVSNG